MARVPLFDIILLLLLFLGAWEFYIIRVGRGVNHVKKPIFTSLYFLFWSFTLSAFFQQRFNNLITNIDNTFLLLIPTFLILNWLVYKVANKYLERPKKLLKKYSDEDFLLLNQKYIIPKSFDILFQQIMIGLLTIMLFESGLNLLTIVLLFAVIFGLLHVPLLKLKDSLGWFYVAFSSLSAVIFPTIIINIDNGLIYTYIIHWAFYTISALFFWTQENDIIKFTNKI